MQVTKREARRIGADLVVLEVPPVPFPLFGDDDFVVAPGDGDVDEALALGFTLVAWLPFEDPPHDASAPVVSTSRSAALHARALRCPLPFVIR
jgi:hypothetical protein